MGKQLFHIILCGIAVMMITIPAGSAIEPTGDYCPRLTFYGKPSDTFDTKVPESKDVFMVLYTKDGKKISFRLSCRIDDCLWKNPYFKRSRPSVFFNNGFRTTPCHPASLAIPAALLERDEANVFVFDQTQFLNGDYISAIRNSELVGELEGNWLGELYQKDGVNRDFQLIGHSLGAQTAGSAGRAFRKYTTKLFPRITGLDPAGPYFELTPLHKLSCADALFVDIIHTDGGMLGIIQPTGHIDFYPNGGFLQPGAPIIPPESHCRSWKYYAESIKYPCNFPAMSVFSKSICLFPRFTSICSMLTSMFSIPYSILFKPSEPKVFMGHDLDPSAGEGIYYLTTNSQPLYGQGDMECDESSKKDFDLFSKIRSIFF